MPTSPSKVAAYLSERIDNSGRLIREIAQDAGIPNPNTISMMRTGVTKVPLARVPGLSSALGIDPKVLFRLCIEEYSPELLSLIEELMSSKVILSENEAKVIKTIRTLSKNRDPGLSKGSSDGLKQFVKLALIDEKHDA